MPTAVGTPVSIYYADSYAVPFTVSDVAAGDDHHRVVVE